jgi:hypothetical protein
MSKEIGLHLQILLTIPHSIMNAIGKTYIFSKGITKHALLITTTKSEESVKFCVEERTRIQLEVEI